MRQSPLSMLDDIGEYYRETGEDFGKQTKKYDTGIAESIGKGEFKKAGEQILDQIVETIPSVAVMAMTGGAGNVAKAGQVTKTMANALPFMSQRNAELQYDTSVPEWLKPVNASLNGLAEVVMDQKFGTQAAIQGIVNRFAGEGRDAAVLAAKDFVSSYVNKAINGGAKYVKPFVNGAVEEASTQLAQNIVDKYTVNPDIDVMEGVADAAIVGSAMTGGISTVGNIIQPQAKSRLQELETAQKEAIAAVNNPEVSEQAKEGLNAVLEANNQEIETIQKESEELSSKLSPEQKIQAEGLSTQIDQLDAVINDPAISEEVKATIEPQREALETQLVDVLTAVPVNEAVQETIVPEPTQTTETEVESVTEPKSIQGKDNIKNHVEELGNDNYLFTHVTTEKDAKGINENGFNISLGTGVSSTLSSLSPNGVNNQIERLINGEVVHRDTNNNSMSVIAVPKSVLDGETSVQDKAEALENWLAENTAMNEDGTLSIPKEFNAGYLSGDRFISGINNKNEVEQVIPAQEAVVEETVSTPEAVTTETVQETIEASESVLKKAEDDLSALKQVKDKVKKYQGSIKRLNDALRAGTISEQQFNDTKARFDDVIADSAPNMPKVTNLTTEEVTQLDNELKNENITTNDFIEYERARAIEDVVNATEAVQEPGVNNGTGTTEVGASETAQESKAGDPIRAFAQKVREGKINKLGGFKAATGFDGAWDLGLEAVATTLDAGASVADAIESGLKAIKQTDWYKNLEDKKDFEDKYKSHMESEYSQSEGTIGITQEETAKTRKQLGIEDYEKQSQSNEVRRQKAEKAIKEGFNVKELINQINASERFTPSREDIEIMKVYNSSLAAAIKKNTTSELLQDRIELIKALDKATSRLGAGLQAVQGLEVAEDNLSNFFFDEMAALGVETLPQGMISELQAKYEKGQAAKEAYEKGYQKALDEFINQQAKNQVSKATPKNRDSIKKTKSDYKDERQKLKDSIREKLRRARGQANAVPVPYLNELIEIAPDVAKLVRSYVEEGVTDIKEIIKNIHSDIVDEIPSITEEDVRDIIAGNYNKKQPTKSDLTTELRDLTTQARLLSKIEELESGMAKLSETGKIRRTQEVDALMKRVRQLEDETGITEQRSLKNKRADLDRRISALKTDIELGNYEVPAPLPKKLKLDKDTRDKQDEYIAFLKETNKRRDKARYEQLSKWRKGWDKFQQILGLRRLIQTSVDFSMPFRQAATVTLNPRYFRTTLKSFSNMFASTFSEKKYDRIMFNIQQDPEYREMVEDKLVLSEVDSKDNLKRDEDFRTSFIYKVPVLGDILLRSNRAAASYVNTARYEIYKKASQRLREQGISRESNPEHYKAAAKWAMNMTGRGNMLEFIENNLQAQRILGDTFYGVRLMSSRFNLLNPNYYAKMPKEVRVEALKDVVSYAGSAAAVLLAAAAAGASVSSDPDDPDFMKARWGTKRYDLVSGGMTQYIRTAFRLLRALYVRGAAEASGDKEKKEKANKYGAFAFKSSLNFFRYKLAPNTAYSLSALTGTDAMGDEFDSTDILKIYPMYYEDMRDALKKEDPPSVIATVLLPNLFGIGFQDYENKPARKPMTEEELRKKLKKERSEAKN